jgi:hypothetical protein
MFLFDVQREVSLKSERTKPHPFLLRQLGTYETDALPSRIVVLAPREVTLG